jgi:hypothetical protein
MLKKKQEKYFPSFRKKENIKTKMKIFLEIKKKEKKQTKTQKLHDALLMHF